MENLKLILIGYCVFLSACLLGASNLWSDLISIPMIKIDCLSRSLLFWIVRIAEKREGGGKTSK